MSSVFRGASFNACSWSDPPSSGGSRVCYLQRTRFESIAEDATSAALDRGRERRDQRTGFALALALVVNEGPMNKLAPAVICIAILLTGCGSPLRPDANAGPNPGGGFYGAPNMNFGRINP